ncbi:acetyltransferase [Prauserella marina]|uniref:Diamine N-acetyltransferase n=1 Tax=Prauserella marina TaxID=530584 RepID=A0A222VWR4_9PSEU|nr:GNAT family N-acetyltransferase [Prauserella marina]ASR38330.1 acetyltransferase [Prauserella marina]PWV78457.1 diamine N-acetyltransferase [Prauserella marina]SDC86417.1 diamine N-acetyltransferase [Prauserella marina]
MNVSLRPLTRENVRAVCDLRLAENQRHLVAPAAYTVAEGNYEPDAILLAIHLEDEPVGVLLVEVESGSPYLVRFMIDVAVQGRGVGRRAVEFLVEELRERGWSSLETSFVPVGNGAEGFWRRCGFRSTGRTHNDEPVFVRML